jgi:Anti-sigma-K factor rskA
MLSERDIEAAHPDAFDFVWGNLPAARRAEFSRHLSGCRYCQAVVSEYSEIGRIIKLLPPHVEPPAGLEDRTVAAMVAALAEEQAEVDRPAGTEDRTATRVYPVPGGHHAAEPETLVRPIPHLRPPAEEETKGPPAPAGQPASAEPAARPMVTRLPVWRRHRDRFAAIAAVAAAIIVAAIVVPLSLGRGPAGVTVVIPLHATAAAKVFGVGAASGQATARQAGESWTFDLSVHGLKPLPGNEVYVCWWAAPGSTKAHPVLATGGSFVVGDSGSATLTMTTGVDPRDFRTMEITVESPGDGALHGPVLLTGQTA